MSSDVSRQFRSAFRLWWREQAAEHGVCGAASLLLRQLWNFVRDSAPERRRSRYGDMEYDWEHRVDTTSGTVGWRERLLGVFHSPYQPTDPAAFREMMAALGVAMEVDFPEFTFIDLGSGKGRTLLMASEYPFKKIVGVEVLPRLHRAAEANIAAYLARESPASAATIESVCLDAREFVFPETPLVLYLFNPLPEAGLRQVIRNLENSCRKAPRSVWILYHYPESEGAIAQSPLFERVSQTSQYSVCRTKS